MENEHIKAIKHSCKVIQEMADHSRSMSIGAKLMITNRIEGILKQLEVIELELLMRK